MKTQQRNILAGAVLAVSLHGTLFAQTVDDDDLLMMIIPVLAAINAQQLPIVGTVVPGSRKVPAEPNPLEGKAVPQNSIVPIFRVIPPNGASLSRSVAYRYVWY